MSAPRPVAPRRLAHRGRVEVAAVWLDAGLVDADRARGRILALWRRGTRVWRLESGWLVELLPPSPLRVEACPGLPLVADGGVWWAAPLGPDEREALAAPPGAVVRLVDGRAVVDRPEPSRLVDPADWIDVSGFESVEVRSLAPPPAPPRAVAVPVERSAREVLGAALPPPDARAAAVRAALAEAAAGRPTAPARPNLWERVAAWWQGRGASAGAASGATSEAGAGAGPSAATGRLGGLGAWLGAVARWLSRGTPPATGRAAPDADETSEPLEPPAAGPLARLRERLRAALARAALRSGLMQLVGRRHARYLAELMEKFERGELDDALRHAIPLSETPGAPGAAPSLSFPRPRGALELDLARRGGATQRSAFSLGSSLFDTLKELYRGAVARLVRQGRIEEAAFVLADLLDAPIEAVELLEQHGLHRLAAELAEARSLEPGLVVRQWVLAGDWDRAVAIARRRRVFADAVLRLERSGRAEAAALRGVWAGLLAEAGDYAAAIEVAEPLPSARHLIDRWLGLAIEGGGPVGARLLALALERRPEDAEALEARAIAVLDDDEPGSAEARLSLAQALIPVATSREPARRLVRRALRRLLRDAAAGRLRLSTQDVERLSAAAGDGLLRADWPSVPDRTGVPLAQRPEPLELTIETSDVGSLGGRRAVVLPDGRVLVALGEAGVRLLTRDGRTVRHFDAPAEDLVLSDRGNRALALARRGRLTRVSRLELDRGTTTAWCTTELGAWTTRYDGAEWWVSGGDGALLCLDATASTLRALWRVPDVHPVALAREGDGLVAVSLSADGPGWWRWTLPGPVLRARPADAAPGEGDDARLFAIDGDRLAVAPRGRPADEALGPPLGVVWQGEARPTRAGAAPDDEGTAPLSLLVGAAEITELEPVAGRLAIGVVRAEGAELWLTTASGPLVLRLRLLGSNRVAARASGSELAVVDDRGRVLVIDLVHGRLLRSLRLRA